MFACFVYVHVSIFTVFVSNLHVLGCLSFILCFRVVLGSMSDAMFANQGSFRPLQIFSRKKNASHKKGSLGC